jgi:hypothetical protein
VGKWRCSSTILSFKTTWGRVVNFTTLPLYPRTKTLGTLWIGVYSIGRFAEKQSLSCRELNSACQTLRYADRANQGPSEEGLCSIQSWYDSVLNAYHSRLALRLSRLFQAYSRSNILMAAKRQRMQQNGQQNHLFRFCIKIVRRRVANCFIPRQWQTEIDRQKERKKGFWNGLGLTGWAC